MMDYLPKNLIKTAAKINFVFYHIQFGKADMTAIKLHFVEDGETPCRDWTLELEKGDGTQ